MKLDILIYAETLNDNIDIEELKDAIAECISDFAGHSMGRDGMYNYLKNVDHEVLLESEGEYIFKKKE